MFELQGKEVVVAEAEYVTGHSGHLRLARGDRVEVLSREDGWLLGRAAGRLGLFPEEYARPPHAIDPHLPAQPQVLFTLIFSDFPIL